MSVGFVMLAHTALHRAAEVARHLAAHDCPVAIHVDARTSKHSFDRFKKAIAGTANIYLAPRMRCDWGQWSLVEASRSTAASLLEVHPELDHVMLISGACLPTKPVAELKSYLERHRDTDFIESVTINEVPWTKDGLCEERFTLTFPFSWKRQKRLFDAWVALQRRFGRTRRVPLGLKPHMGSQWWCLTRATLQTILTDPDRRRIDRYFRSVWIPDESYYQTLVRHYGTKVESRSLTLSKFDFQGKPHVFYDDHLMLLRQNGAWFARKIWPGANRLYRTLLQDTTSTPEVARPGAAYQAERAFAEAIQRRTRGRPGLYMSSRFPRAGFENGLTAAPYAVFHGFDDVFEDFPAWIASATGTRAHGRLFAPEGAEFADGQTHYAGALSSAPALRDYNPRAFLTNLIWNTRGEHQSFLYSPRDTQEVTSVLADDPHAMISVISGAWALSLLASGRSPAACREEAAELQRVEALFLDRLRERRTRAQVRIWTLAEFIDRPAAPLQAILDDMSGTDTPELHSLPKMRPMQGIAAFLQELRNAGMNPYVAGDLAEPGKPRMMPGRRPDHTIREVAGHGG